MTTDIERRCRLHAALAEPVRLRIVDHLRRSDRAPGELADTFDLRGNLLAHHLGVLHDAGLIERIVSAGDRRRRYVRLRPGALAVLDEPTAVIADPLVFVCTHNSARSQLAAALWSERIGTPVASAGTHPAAAVHPEAVAAAARVGLDLSGATPRLLDGIDSTTQVITVCDRAHEELDPDDAWWHWSIPDPVEVGTPAAFDAVVDDIVARLPPKHLRSAS